MAVFSWIHISDIHMRKEYEESLKLIMVSLRDALRNLPSIVNDDTLFRDKPFLFLTGDLAFHGKKPEYDKCLEIVINPILEQLNIQSSNVFICPGNHDVFRKKSIALAIQSYLKEHTDNIIEVLKTDSELYSCLKRPFINYISFVKSYFPHIQYVDPCLFSINNLDTLNLSIISLNTAWCSFGGDHEKSRLFIGFPQVVKAFNSVHANNFIVSLGHHPLFFIEPVWFSNHTDTSRSAIIIRDKSDLVCTGHIHEPNFLNVSDISDKLSVSYSGALYTDEYHPFRPLSFTAGWSDSILGTSNYYIFRYEETVNEWKLLKSFRPDITTRSHSTHKRLTRTHTLIASTLESDIHLSVPKVRSKDYLRIYEDIKSRKHDTKILWITGSLPGIGKTTFAFELTNIIFDGEKPIYIPRGKENDPREISKFIMHFKHDEWFDEWRNQSKTSINTTTIEELIQFIVYFIKKYNLWLLIESGESIGEKQYLQSIVNFLSTSSSGIHIVLTCRHDITGLSSPPNHIFELGPFSKDDCHAFLNTYGIDYPEISEVVHSKYKGHPLTINSIITSIVSGGLADVNLETLKDYFNVLPNEIVDYFKSLWDSLTDYSRNIIYTISEYPDLGIEAVVNQTELKSSGLLSVYPFAISGEVKYYVHPLIKDSCCASFDSDKKLKALLDVIGNAYELGYLEYGPVLLDKLIVSGDCKKCDELIINDGRAWIECANIPDTLKVLQQYLDNCDSNSNICLFQIALCELFSGNYKAANTLFKDLEKDNDLSDQFKLVIKSEQMECYRRLGMINDAIEIFFEIEKYGNVTNRSHNNTYCYLNGVTNFLKGHLLRSLGGYEQAAGEYNKAERLFRDCNVPSGIIERMHCHYCLSMTNLILHTSDTCDLESILTIHSIKSNFINGLASYLSAVYHTSREKYQLAFEANERAIMHFKLFNSPSYVNRSNCFKGLLYLLLGDIENALILFKSILISSNKYSSHYIIADLFVNVHGSDVSTSKEQIGYAINILLNSGKIATTATILKLIFSMELDSINLSSVDLNCSLRTVNNNTSGFEIIEHKFSSIEGLSNFIVKRLEIDSIFSVFPIIE